MGWTPTGYIGFSSPSIFSGQLGTGTPYIMACHSIIKRQTIEHLTSAWSMHFRSAIPMKSISTETD
eukprot:1146848-Pelagomonas_calceolata.AAC.2